MKVYAVINQKGGVGKTTVAAALGSGLALRGRRVLFVDLDAQGNLTHTVSGGNPATQEQPHGILGVLRGQIPPEKALTVPKSFVRAALGVRLLPATPGLALADTEITSVGKEHKVPMEYRLREALAALTKDFDCAVLDTPPALGILTVNALTAGTDVIIPAQADVYSLQGIGQLHGTIRAVRAYCNPELAVRGILLTRYQPRTVLSREIAETLAETAAALGTRLFRTTLRESVVVREAQASGADIFSYAPKSGIAADFRAWIDELMESEVPEENQ